MVRVQILGGVPSSEPSLAIWAHRPIGGLRCRMPEISVQLRVGPLQSIQSCSLVAKAAPLQGDDRWFESIQDYSRPDTQIGKAVRLRPGCLQVRLPLWVLGSNTSSWSSLECSPACHAGGHGFKSHRGRFLMKMARYANRQSGQAQTLVSVGSTPTRATWEMCRLGIGEPKWL